MDIRKVKKLIEMLEDSNLNEIEIKEGEESVKLVKAGSNLSQTLVAQPAVQLPEENSISKEESQKVKKLKNHRVRKLNHQWWELSMELLTQEQKLL